MDRSPCPSRRQQDAAAFHAAKRHEHLASGVAPAFARAHTAWKPMPPTARTDWLAGTNAAPASRFDILSKAEDDSKTQISHCRLQNPTVLSQHLTYRERLKKSLSAGERSDASKQDFPGEAKRLTPRGHSLSRRL